MRQFAAFGLTLAAILTATAFLATSQASDPYTVTRLDDPAPDGCGANGCSLREAITEASGAGGLVEVPAGVITLAGGPIALTGQFAIKGAGADQTTVNGGGQRVFDVQAGAVTTIKDLKITGAGGTGCGAAIANAGTLTLTRAELSGNSITGQGAGLCNTGTAQLLEVKIANNAATHNQAGTGIWNNGTIGMNRSEVSGNTATGTTGGGDAAGIFNQGDMIVRETIISGNSGSSAACDDCSSASGVANTGTFELYDSTISGNLADTMAAFENRGTATIDGSTIANNTAGTFFNDRQKVLTITNSTISGNSGGTYPKVGTAAITSYGTLNLIHVTMVNNPASWIKYGSLQNFGAVQIGNSILANNGQDNCNTGGTITSYGGNVVDDATCVLASLRDVVADPMVGPLADNDGLTQTHSLNAGSPAIDNARSFKCTGPDQRGAPRPVGAECDSGSFEVGGIVPTPTPSPSPTPAPIAYPMGDTNCNDRIDSGDITAELRLVAGLDAPDNCGRETLPCIQSGPACFPQWTDTNCDGDIVSLDAVPVLLHLVGTPQTSENCAPIGEMPGNG